MPRTKTLTIPDDVKEILQDSTVTDQMITLPGTLERSVYVRVDKILKAMGLKWNKALGGHAGPGINPQEMFHDILEAGKVVNTQQTYQEFFTPPDLASQMYWEWHSNAMLTPGRPYRVLEPSAGDGALIRATLADIPSPDQVSCLAVEIQAKNCQRLREQFPDLCVIEADFLKLDRRLFGLFDAVVMNPPFNANQDIQHVQHAFEFLKPGGHLVAIISPAARNGAQKAQKAFQEFIQRYMLKEQLIKEGTFKQSGTKVQTHLIVLQRPFESQMG